METNWKIGDIAICIKVGSLNGESGGRFPCLRLQSEYIVQNVYLCPKCKRAALDVGLAGSGQNTKCCTEKIPMPEIHWCAAERFVKKDDRTLEEQLKEALANEEYELAEQLQKKMKVAEV